MLNGYFPEPPPGFESRIKRAVAEAQEKRRSRRWLWVAVAAAAVLAAAAVIPLHKRGAPVVHPAVVSVAKVPMEIPRAMRTEPPVEEPVRVVVKRRKARVARLTPEEQRWMTVASVAPPEVFASLKPSFEAELDGVAEQESKEEN